MTAQITLNENIWLHHTNDDIISLKVFNWMTSPVHIMWYHIQRTNIFKGINSVTVLHWDMIKWETLHNQELQWRRIEWRITRGFYSLVWLFVHNKYTNIISNLHLSMKAKPLSPISIYIYTAVLCATMKIMTHWEDSWKQSYKYRISQGRYFVRSFLVEKLLDMFIS